MLTRYSAILAGALLLISLAGPTLPRCLGQQADKVRVTCPAIELDQFQSDPNTLEDAVGPIQLVVLGTASRPEKNESRGVVYELLVEKVLYGSTPDKTLRLHDRGWSQGPVRRIFALCPQAYGGPTDYDLKYQLDVKEEKAQLALAAARLDYHTLAADSIFVGKETAIETVDDHRHLVEVIRLLHGFEPSAGEKTTVVIYDHGSGSGKIVKLRPEPMLYFVRNDRDVQGSKVYRLDTRLPAACEADVAAALKRRDLYPIVNTTAEGKKFRGREVVFRGSVDEAIELLGSARMGAVKLAVQAITRQREEAPEKLAAAIEREMFRRAEPGPDALHKLQSFIRLLGRLGLDALGGFAASLLERELYFVEAKTIEFFPQEPRWGEFRKLRNLIRLLGRLGGGSPEGPLCRLLEKELDYVQSRPPIPKYPLRGGDRNEADTDSVNHALAWLAMAIDEQALGQRYGTRLIKLREATQGHWKAELQLALDVAHVEDNLELAALAQMPPAHTVRSQARLYHSQGAMSAAFSADGKFLATGGEWGGVRVWSTSDWTNAQTIDLEGQISQLSFSPDDKFITATARHGADLTDHRFEWRTGAVVAQPPALPREIDSRHYQETSEQTPDGRHRVTASARHSDAHIKLQVLPTTGRGRALAEVQIPSAVSNSLTLAIAPDGRQVAIGSGDVRLGIYSVPDLNVIKEFLFPCRVSRSERISRLAYSPDGKLLAACQGMRPTPRLFRVETSEEITPFDGHGHYAIDLRFLPDGKTLRSIGEDGTVCTWDAATLKMHRRTFLPTARRAASVRPTDGRYVLCPLTSDPRKPIQVVDVETGKTVCEVALPLTWDAGRNPEDRTAFVRCMHWLNDQEALCTGFSVDHMGSRDHWWRFNYRTGQILEDGPIPVDSPKAHVTWGEVTEDGKHVFFIEGAGKGTWGPLKSEWIDTVTLTSQKSDEAGIERQPNGDFGLVRGGKYFHIGSHIFDRQSLKLVAARDFPRHRLSKIAFSPDGTRYAAETTRAKEPDDWYGIDEWSSYRKYSSLVRVHETLTGRALLAFSPAASVSRFAFSADGQRLATACDDGTIEVRDVPSPTVR